MLLDLVRPSPSVLMLVGELDFSNADWFLGEALSDAAMDKDFVIDLSALSFMDVAGARAVVDLADDVSRLIIRHPQQPVIRLFGLLELNGRISNLLMEPS